MYGDNLSINQNKIGCLTHGANLWMSNPTVTPVVLDAVVGVWEVSVRLRTPVVRVFHAGSTITVTVSTVNLEGIFEIINKFMVKKAIELNL